MFREFGTPQQSTLHMEVDGKTETPEGYGCQVGGQRMPPPVSAHAHPRTVSVPVTAQSDGGRRGRGGPGDFSRGRNRCVSVVPSGGVCEQDAHPGARGRRLEPLGRVEHVQPHLRDGSPLPAAEMRQPPVSVPRPSLSGASGPGSRAGSSLCLTQGSSPKERLRVRPTKCTQRPGCRGVASVRRHVSLCEHGCSKCCDEVALASSPEPPRKKGFQRQLDDRPSWPASRTSLVGGHSREACRLSGERGQPSNWLLAELGAGGLPMSHQASAGSAVLCIHIVLSCPLRTIRPKIVF